MNKKMRSKSFNKEQREYAFWMKVNKTDSCWLWTACKDKKGYGQFRGENRTTIFAHRYSYELKNGLIPEGKFVCHKCDVPLCVNPDHLFLSNHKGNMKDMTNKGRQVKGVKHISSKLTEEQVIKIRKDTRKQKDIAKEYGVTQPQISYIQRHITWKHVDPTNIPCPRYNK